MAQVIANPARSAALPSAEGLISRIRKAIADYRLYAATLDELRQLSDRDLADLGIARSDIVGIARESVYGA